MRKKECSKAFWCSWDERFRIICLFIQLIINLKYINKWISVKIEQDGKQKECSKWHMISCDVNKMMKNRKKEEINIETLRCFYVSGKFGMEICW